MTGPAADGTPPGPDQSAHRSAAGESDSMIDRARAPDATPLLEVDDLRVSFPLRSGAVHAVNGAQLTLHAGETLAIVGESGSGKSATAHAIMGLTEPSAAVAARRLCFRGDDLRSMSAQQRRRLRGVRMAMIFQDASAALNPVFPVGWQIAEPLRVHAGLSRKRSRERAIELMERVGIPSARERVRSYPHELSGGMRQRIMIAMAIALDPDLLIADEPTSALDLTVQAQVLELLQDLQSERGMGMILITHDLGVVAQATDRAAVMYAGRVVESGATPTLLTTPAHPYTEGLIRSLPTRGSGTRLQPIHGAPPSPTAFPAGCAFHPRCDYRTAVCLTVDPPRYDVTTGAALASDTPDRPRQHLSACHHHREVGP